MSWNDFTKKVKEFFTGKKESERLDTSDYAEGEKQLNDKLGQMQEEFDESQYDVGKGYEDISDLLPEEQEFKFLEYEGDDADTIRQKTKEQFDKLLEDEKNKVGDSYKTKVDSVQSKIDDAQKQYDFDKKDVDSEYADFQKAIEQELVKKGLYRSSINKGSKDANESMKQKQIESLTNDLQLGLDKLNADIAKLQGEESVALQELDLSYAQKLKNQIDSLLAKRQNEIEKIDKYNNTLREKQSKYIADRAQAIENQLAQRKKDELSIKSMEDKYGYSGEKQKNYQQRYDLAYEYYSQLPKDVALQMLDENKDLQNYLGLYFGKLLSSIAKNWGAYVLSIIHI